MKTVLVSIILFSGWSLSDCYRILSLNCYKSIFFPESGDLFLPDGHVQFLVVIKTLKMKRGLTISHRSVWIFHKVSSS